MIENDHSTNRRIASNGLTIYFTFFYLQSVNFLTSKYIYCNMLIKIFSRLTEYNLNSILWLKFNFSC